jgi:D-aminoacyl-tRNA deacylase
VYVIVLSLGDPVSRAFLKLAQPMPLLKTVGEIEIRRLGEHRVVIHRGEPTEFGAEDLLASLGAHAVFISRHEMTNPRPMLTVHAPGPWPDVSVSNPRLATAIFRALCRLAPEPFACAFEATHHPPSTSSVSATFVEVGSTEREWGDRRAVEALMCAVSEALGRERGGGVPTMVIGDLHYSTAASDALRGEIDIGHVVPRYASVTAEDVLRAREKHTESVKRAVVFRKGVRNPLRAEVVRLLKERGVEVTLRG